VDDDQDTQNMLGVIIHHHGHQLAVCSSAEEAFKYLSGHSAPDIIMLDIYLPGIDGYQTLQKLKNDPAIAQHTQIVAITAYYLNETEQETQERGFSGYLKKPLNALTLVDYLQKLANAF